MLRVSVSDVDGFGFYKRMEDMTLKEYLDRLYRKEPPPESAQAGSAMHKILEKSEPGQPLPTYRRWFGTPFEFVYDVELDLYVPPQRELKAEVPLRVAGEDIILVGKLDALDGRHGWDWKFSAKPKPEYFMDAFQWRVYCMMFHLRAFSYGLFGMQKKRDGKYHITSYEPYTFHPYVGMEDEVQSELTEFVQFVRQHAPLYGVPKHEQATTAKVSS